MNVGVVTALMRSGERGGAEAFYQGLTTAVEAAGHQVRQLAVPIDESNFQAVLDSYSRCYDLDVSAFDLVISTKAPTYMVRHPRHVCYLVHTLRVFYDRFESEYGEGTDVQRRQRRLIHRLDKAALDPSRISRHFSIGRTNYHRLCDADAWWRQVPFTPLHLPPAFDSFLEPRRGEWVFLPGRLHRWKRPDLVVRAFRRVNRKVPLLIAGVGEDEARLRRLAGDDPRVRFLGAVTERELLELYAGAIVVPFVPIQEDYGLVTIEAFRSGKPVITCADSGEPLEFVRDGATGFVVEPHEQALADRIEFLIDHPETARAMGERGRRSVSHLGWEPIVSALLDAAAPRRRGQVALSAPPLKVTVLDMQPIDPPLGGGRLRLLGLYHDLGDHVSTSYVGTFDWPGERPRAHRLTPTLFEVDVPLSDRHFSAAADLKQQVDGRTVIDVSFPLLGHLSPEYIRAARDAAASADIVVCSHPWVYPHVADLLQAQDRLVVYDAHNVESVLRYRLLGGNSRGLDLVKRAAAVERDLCQRADLTLVCSHAERELVHRLYGTAYDKCLVVPNGTFAGQPGDRARRETRAQLGLGGGPVAVFIGSSYPPNEEAAVFITSTLAPALPDVTFVICGGVGSIVDRLDARGRKPANVRATGVLDDASRQAYLAAADIAINPMFSGQGTNIKMFDFMAAGLPVVSTAIGARGIADGSSPAMLVCPAAEFVAALRYVLADPEGARRMGEAGRKLVREHYSWERLSPALGRLLTRHWSGRSARPYFSVVVATYERQGHLSRLLDCLARQSCRDFEVILVDQSAAPWEGLARWSALDLFYVHTDVRGAVGARNTGAWYSRGDVIAFTDDDCEPEAAWLQNARRYFDNPRVVGVEGLIVSDKVNDPKYRAVTNLGFEGIGFMTANLFIRRDTFNALDGMDERFDHPHFREDTDLGWRASALGDIPFGHDVRVFHPAHPRAIDREGHEARAAFFEKDALLLKKHPGRYKSLFLREGHYLHTAGFHEHFTRGAQKYGVRVDEFLAGFGSGTAAL